MHDACGVANEFIRRANEQGAPLTHLQIQKLVYFAHARMLVLHRLPLVQQGFQAWGYGPVVADLYQALKLNGSEAVVEEIPVVEPPTFSSREIGVFDWCFKRYGRLSGGQLTSITHASGSPWSMASGRNEDHISDEDIVMYHAKEMAEESQRALGEIHSNPAFQQLVIGIQERGRFSNGYTLEELKQRIDSHSARST